MFTEQQIKHAEDYKGRGKLPYRLLLERYRTKLDRTRNKAEREEIEVIIALLLAAIETQEKIDQLIVMVGEKFG